MTDQPEWLQKTVEGLVGGHRYLIHLERKRFAIIVCPGRTVYLDRGSGSHYFPTQYILCEKGKNYWHHTWKTVHTGRITIAKKGELVALLQKTEREGV